jgi:hypothetical protein
MKVKRAEFMSEKTFSAVEYKMTCFDRIRQTGFCTGNEAARLKAKAKAEYKEACKRAKKSIRHDFTVFFEEKAIELEGYAAAGNQAGTYRILRSWYRPRLPRDEHDAKDCIATWKDLVGKLPTGLPDVPARFAAMPWVKVRVTEKTDEQRRVGPERKLLVSATDGGADNNGKANPPFFRAKRKKDL